MARNNRGGGESHKWSKLIVAVVVAVVGVSLCTSALIAAKQQIGRGCSQNY